MTLGIVIENLISHVRNTVQFCPRLFISIFLHNPNLHTAATSKEAQAIPQLSQGTTTLIRIWKQKILIRLVLQIKRNNGIQKSTRNIIWQPINGAIHKYTWIITDVKIGEVLDPPPSIGTQSINTNSILVLKERNSNNLIIVSGRIISKAKCGREKSIPLPGYFKGGNVLNLLMKAIRNYQWDLLL